MVSFLGRAEVTLFPRYWLLGLFFANDWGHGLLDLGLHWAPSNSGCVDRARDERHLLVTSGTSVLYEGEGADDKLAPHTTFATSIHIQKGNEGGVAVVIQYSLPRLDGHTNR